MHFMKLIGGLKTFLFVFLGYLLCSYLGEYFSLNDQVAAPIWFGSGFAVFCVTILGIPTAIPIFVASSFRYVIADMGLGLGLMVSLGVVGEALLARAIFLSLIKKRSVFLHHNRMVAVFVSAVLASLIGATFGVGSHIQLQPHLVNSHVNDWLTWYSGDVIGCLLFFPLLMSLRKYFRSRIRPKWNKNKIVVFVLSSGALGLMLFKCEQVGLLLLILPLLTFVLIYCGATSALLFANLAGIFCAWSIQLGHGPFSDGRVSVNGIAAIFFIAMVALCVLVLVSLAKAQSLRHNLRFLFFIWVIAFGITLGFELLSWLGDIEYFQYKTHEARDLLEQRMKDYERALQGISAFYQASDLVTFHDWKIFAKEFDLPRMLPGSMGIGFIQVIKKEPESIIIRRLRRDGVSIKKIVPIPGFEELETAPDRFVVKYFEPQDHARNIIGVDIGVDPARRQVAEYGRDHGIPVLLTRIKLMQDVANRIGFVLLVPVYLADNGQKDVAERRRSHLGWVYAPFIVEEFIKTTLRRELADLDISIAYKDNNQPVFSSSEMDPLLQKKMKLRTSVDLKFANVDFVLHARPNVQFDYSHAQIASGAAFVSVVLGLLVAIVFVNLQLINRRVYRQVDLRTQELYRAQKLAETHRIKSIEAARLASLGEMAGGIAHEINNPLSIILAKAFNLKTKLKKGKLQESEILDYIEKIEQTSNRIAKIVKGMRTLSYDGSQYDFETVSLNKIIDDVLDIGREKFKSKGIEIRLDLEIDPKVRCRPIQISQVLINLLNNAEHAIEFMRDPWIQLKTFMDQNGAGVEVTDSGPGIPTEVAKRMMEPFFTTKEVGRGTGLGLSIAQSIMKENMGTLEYKPDGGHTTFVIRLPKAES